MALDHMDDRFRQPHLKAGRPQDDHFGSPSSRAVLHALLREDARRPFAELLRRYAPATHRLATRDHLPEPALIEDGQVRWLAALELVDRPEARESLRAWLIRLHDGAPEALAMREHYLLAGLKWALLTMSPLQTHVMVLRDACGLSAGSVCALLKLTRASQRSILCRGRRHVRQALTYVAGPVGAMVDPGSDRASGP